MTGLMYRAVFFLACLIVCYRTVNGADKTYLRNTITNYFSNVRNEAVNSTEKQRVRNFIQEQFESFGLETHVHEFTAPIKQAGTFYNIIGLFKGSRFGKPTDKIIGVGAHYDTVDISNGVDDNGSGMAAMLETARTIGQQNKGGVTRKNTIMFVAFDLEEYGIYGSEKFITEWLNVLLNNNYTSFDKMVPHGVVILDTIMEYNDSSNSQLVPGSKEQFQALFPTTYTNIESDNLAGDFIATIYRKTDEADTYLANTFQTQWNKQGHDEMEIEMFGLPEITHENRYAFDNFLRSDHSRFWERFIPAIFLTDSANFRGDMQVCYHKSCDNVEVMLTEENVDFLNKITDTLVATVDKLSDRNDMPASASQIESVVLLTIVSSFAVYFLH